MNNKLYVGNLPYSTDEDQIRELFGEYGNIEEVVLIADRESGRPKGFGFVTFETEGAAKEAQEKMDGQEIGGRNVKVNPAQPRTDRGGNRGGRSWQ